MKNTIARISGSIFFAVLLLIPAPGHSQIARPSQIQLGPRLPRRLSSQNPSMQHAQALNRDATASPDVTWVQCPPPAQAFGATCGQLPVPLDRQHPEMETINIYFELYLHTNPGPAVSAMLFNAGGPGLSTTDYRTDVLFLFGQNLDVHDVLLIDDRGRGLSQAINCPELQHGTASFKDGEGDCAAQLGAADSWYGTGDIAMDTDAVRAALGYYKVDYWGGSYGGEDVSAYATRFGEHLRSIILDAPMGPPGLRPFLLDGDNARATAREVRLDCQRSPTCSADHFNPDTEFAQLIQEIQREPVQGWAYNANGQPVNVKLHEGALLYLSSFPTGVA
jgi:pimeloyl-ACP methyl ester carboxylesterase